MNHRLGLAVDPEGSPRKAASRDCISRLRDLPASAPLALVVDANFDGKAAYSCRDDPQGRLETKIAEIAARVIVAGEAKFRRSLREAEEREEQFRRFEEQRRREAIAARNAERLKRLRESGELLRQAEDLRALIKRVRSKLNGGAVGGAELDAWELWAKAEADRLDPVLSGQIMTHLTLPSDEQV